MTVIDLTALVIKRALIDAARANAEKDDRYLDEEEVERSAQSCSLRIAKAWRKSNQVLETTPSFDKQIELKLVKCTSGR